jgi:hypothetical protein
MSRPRNTNELDIIKIRTVTLMNMLKDLAGVENPNQFAEWFNSKSVHLNWCDTKGSKKWYPYFEGRVKQKPVKVLGLLDQICYFASSFYGNGPECLWDAMWGAPFELWDIGFSTVLDFKDGHQGAMKLIAYADNSLTFAQSVYNFQWALLMNQVIGNEPELFDLSKSIAIYRIDQEVSKFHSTGETGLYKCIHVCLSSECVINELSRLGILDFVSNELIKLEISRLKNDQYYRAAVGVGDIVKYAQDPFAFCSKDIWTSAFDLEEGPSIISRMKELSARSEFSIR